MLFRSRIESCKTTPNLGTLLNIFQHLGLQLTVSPTKPISLRRCGADITRVRKMFRDDMEAYRAKAEAMREAEVYKNQFAIAVCSGDIESPTVLAAQTANELLDISGINARCVKETGFPACSGLIMLPL